MKRTLTVIALLFATPMLAACGPAINETYQILTKTGRVASSQRLCKRKSPFTFGNRINSARFFNTHKTQGYPSHQLNFSSLEKCKKAAPFLNAYWIYSRYGVDRTNEITNPEIFDEYYAGQRIVNERKKQNLNRRCINEGFEAGTEQIRMCRLTMSQNDLSAQSARYAAEDAEKAARDAEIAAKISSSNAKKANNTIPYGKDCPWLQGCQR